MMWTICCPACYLRLDFEEGAPAGRLDCPACGAAFHIDETTGGITLFYEEGEEPEDAAAPLPPDVEAAAAEPTEQAPPPEEVVANIGRKWQDRLAQGERNQSRRFHRAFFAGAAVVIALGVMIQLTEDRPPWGAFLCVIGPVALFVGLLTALATPVLFDNVKEVVSRSRSVTGEPQEEPDLDEIAERASAGLIRRRPLPSSCPDPLPNQDGAAGAHGVTAKPPAPPAHDRRDETGTGGLHDATTTIPPR
jgi:hypothetical protein